MQNMSGGGELGGYFGAVNWTLRCVPPPSPPSITRGAYRWPLHVPPPTFHAAAGVEGPPHYHPPPWPRQPR
eukprot:scaffold109392_cov72-Phaeocystis_antarctica.AAC.8